LQFDHRRRLQIYDKAGRGGRREEAKNANGHEQGARTSGVTRRGRPVAEPEGINVTEIQIGAAGRLCKTIRRTSQKSPRVLHFSDTFRARTNS
jgi:hypothetical protein